MPFRQAGVTSVVKIFVNSTGQEIEGEESGLFLYKRLEAVGLQQHYVRLTAVGVHSAARLSPVTMEDYPILGISSAEDRNQLLRLVQMLKSLELWCEAHDYNDSNENRHVVGDSLTCCSCLAPDEDVCDLSGKGERLNFSGKTFSHHQKLCRYPAHVHVSARPDRTAQARQRREAAGPLHPQFVSGCVELKEESDGWIDYQNTKRDPRRKFTSRPPPIPSHKLISETLPSTQLGSRLAWQQEGKEISRNGKISSEKSSRKTLEQKTDTIPVYELRPAGYNYGLPLSSTPVPNKRQPRRQRISVCVRKRPLTHTECRGGEADVVTTLSEVCVTVRERKEAVDLSQYVLQHRFYFDHVFGEESTNEEVYQRTAYPLVQHMLHRGSATCIAYGQTGAGKTHTMLGSSSEGPGLYALAVRDIFSHLSGTKTRSPLLAFVSFFEIYCGQLYDLLNNRKRLFAREDGQKVVHITGLREVRVDSVSSLLQVVSHGMAERTQGMSGVNAHSSRSHAMLQLQLRGPNQQMAGRMWFVDLAGSERASDTREPDRQSRMEGAEINQSLLALKECIRSLDQAQSHTPFRQSKLTQVLKDSFLGDSMTCMIANISPGQAATEHTLNTLRYADRVKELRGQKGQGGSRGKTMSSKQNVSVSVSCNEASAVTRARSPPKRPKLGRQGDNVVRDSSISRSTTEDTVFCSTPKNSSCTRARVGTGPEQLTPIGGFLEISGQRESPGRKDGEREKDQFETSNHNRCISGKCHLQDIEKQLEFSERGVETQRGSLNKEIGWNDQGGHEENRDTFPETEKQRKIRPQMAEQKERERHLKQYHQQLQQFIPSFDSLSERLTSPCFCSEQGPRCSTSPPWHFSQYLVSARAGTDADAFGCKPDFETFNNKDKCELGHSALCDSSKDQRVLSDAKKSKNVKERGNVEKEKTLIPRDEGQFILRKESKRPVRVETGGKRRKAWLTPAEIPQIHTGTNAGRDDKETLLSEASISQSDTDGKMPVLSQGKASTDFSSDVMEPLSVSLLEVDQQVATASFLQGKQSKDPNPKPKWHRKVCSNHPANISVQPNSSSEAHSDEENYVFQVRPHLRLSMLSDNHHAQCRVVQAHWDQMEEMETLFQREGTLLYQQPDMEFGEYVHKLGEIMARKARCVHAMMAHLQPYLKSFNQRHNHEEDSKNHIF